MQDSVAGWYSYRMFDRVRLPTLLCVAVAPALALAPALAAAPAGLARYAAAVGGALLLQSAGVVALRRRTGPERGSWADLLTLGRATVGSLLAGLIASGAVTRGSGLGVCAWGLALLAATLSDWLDGPLARHVGATKLGAALDIEADSWLTLWVAGAAVAWGGLPWWVLLPPALHYAFPALDLLAGALPRGGGPAWSRVTGVAQMALLLAALAPVDGAWRDALLAVVALPISAAQGATLLALLTRRLRRALR